VNPYNCTKPGNLFVGYKDLLEEIVDGFYNGNSFAIIGGRRIGKTSLLMQLEKRLKNEKSDIYHFIPCRFSIQELGKITPSIMFERIYNFVTQDINAESWKHSESGNEYQEFLKQLASIVPNLNDKYGDNWVIVLMIDELDAALSKLKDDQFFQNLRNFLMESPFNANFRLVATGVKDLAQLISSGSSPLNNLIHKYLGILDEKQAIALVQKGFNEWHYQGGWMELLFRVTGRHPFILQGFLEKLWKQNTVWNRKSIHLAAQSFLKEHKDFQHWIHMFSDADKAVYRCLVETSEDKIYESELRRKIEETLKEMVGDAITVLSYHGVINDSDNIQIAGTLFRDWYIKNCSDYSPSEILKQLKSEISQLSIDKNAKNKILESLDKALKNGDKNSIKSSLKVITDAIKTTDTTAESLSSIIDKLQKLGYYAGYGLGWLVDLLY
jgi:hypothetical protein